MTEPNEPTPAPVEPTEPVDDTDDAEPQTIEQARKLRSENRSLRSRLHALETDYEGAVTRLAAMEHAEVERHAAEVLVDPSDVWRAQPDTIGRSESQRRFRVRAARPAGCIGCAYTEVAR
jgi:hypothetical protein